MNRAPTTIEENMLGREEATRIAALPLPEWFYVKCRKPGERAYWFVGSGEACTRLRVHAVRHHGDRTEVLAKYHAENPGLEFIITEFRG